MGTVNWDSLDGVRVRLQECPLMGKCKNVFALEKKWGFGKLSVIRTVRLWERPQVEIRLYFCTVDKHMRNVATEKACKYVWLKHLRDILSFTNLET